MIDGILLIITMVVPAIVLHELAHGYTALWCGDSTAKDQGRLSFNPIKHIDPVGSLLVPGVFFLLYQFGVMKSLFLFGWAKPVPVNFSRLHNGRLGMMIIAAAGPLTNIIIAALLIQLYKLPVLNPIDHLLGWGILFNLILAVFNLIPIPPLDGSRIVTSLLPAQLARQYAYLEPFGFVILIVLLQLNMLQFLYPIVSNLGGWLGIQI